MNTLAVTITYFTQPFESFSRNTKKEGISIIIVDINMAIVIGPCGTINIRKTLSKYTNAINEIVVNVIHAANLFASSSFLAKILLLSTRLPPKYYIT
jgi:hypothetical protein